MESDDGEASALKRITACRITSKKPYDPGDKTNVVKAVVSHPGVCSGDPYLLMDALRDGGGAELVCSSLYDAMSLTPH